MLLPVLASNNTPISGSGGPTDPSLAALADSLRAALRGQVRFGDHDRALYSTDASIYQQTPLGVVIPADAADLAAAVAWCNEHAIPMLPRGGGTSLAGQCTNRAVVLDTSSFFRQISDIDPASATLYAQSGVAIDEINNELTRRAIPLFYAPDPATTAQAAIGGTIGNNASGARSIKYGRTVDSILAIDAVVASGAQVRFEPGAGTRDPIALKLADGVISICRKYEHHIRERYPKTLRRNAGYALDMILQQLDAGATAHTLNLVPLICGSEGTLCAIAGARLKLFPQPKAKGLGLMSFASVDEAIAVVPAILAAGPSAVEMVDDVVIEAALNNLECAKYVQAFPTVDGKSPVAVLYVEYHAASQDELTSSFQKLQAVATAAPLRLVTDAPGMADAWKLRKAGEPLLHGLPGARKPITFVEDNAVPVENLARFVREFRQIITREGTRSAFWAHASVGVLHVRPMLDIRSPIDRAALLRIAIEVADLAKACGGVMSGEHGDGKVRGPLLERFYGPEIMQAFREVKALFDPQGLFNPGNIVAPGPIESLLQGTRIDPPGTTHATAPHVPHISTYFEYTKDEGFEHAVERCNGAGVCRKQSGGTMCPSYRATMDERHSTRGRGNALRLAITGQLPGTAPEAARWSDPETIKTLDLCLSCKACKTECPSNVDMSKLKAEYTAQRYKTKGAVPLAKRLVGHVRWLNKLGSLTPGLANWFNETPLARAVINRVMHMHPKRSMPQFSASLYSLWSKAPATPAASNTVKPKVVLFADCFTTYNESSLGLAAKRLLEALGYDVELPKVGCCARSMISVGMLQEAIETADTTLNQLRDAILSDDVKAILVVEPSCLSSFKDDWLSLNCHSPLTLRQKLAVKSQLVEEFIDAHWETHPNRAAVAKLTDTQHKLGAPVLFHAHCHQKALWGPESSARALRRVLGDRLKVLPTGCCGMAGSFGYDADKFDLSLRIASLTGEHGESAGGLLPFLTKHPAATLLATGTSCRHQVHDATNHERAAIHPVQFLASLV